MGIAPSLLLIAAGAVLAWAVDVSSSAVNIHTVGDILLAVGCAGLLLSLVFWSSRFGPNYYTSCRSHYREGPPAV